MLENIWNDIILLNLKDFENIGVDFYINIFLFFLSFAIVLFALVFELSHGVMHTVVKQLIRHGAIGKDNARTLSELGLNDSFSVKLMLGGQTRLSKIARRTNEPDISYDSYMKLDGKEQKKLGNVDFSSESFYISEEKKDEADKIYATYAFSLPRFLVFCLFVFLIWGAVAAVSYEVLAYLNSVIIKQ